MKVEVGTKIIRIKTGQHYEVEKIESVREKGSIFKRTVWYSLKSAYHESLDLKVREEELDELFKLDKVTRADLIRGMSDEELAKNISSLIKRTQEQKSSVDDNVWLKWLQTEVN